MNHLTEEQLILHYYGESEDSLAAEQHLEACRQCQEQYAGLQRVLNTVDSLPIPERGPEYGAAVWGRIEGRLAGGRWWGGLVPQWRWAAAAAAVAVLIVAAFLAGRYTPPLHPGRTQLADGKVRERVLLVAVGDYLERSQMVLVELANARGAGPLDISAEQERARDLVSETRLYRQTAASTGASDVAAILDELERVLVDIARGPSELSSAQVEQWRDRLDAAGILFKIRVVNSNVNSRSETAPDASRRTL
jgi:hypothetical protein